MKNVDPPVVEVLFALEERNLDLKFFRCEASWLAAQESKEERNVVQDGR